MTPMIDSQCQPWEIEQILPNDTAYQAMVTAIHSAKESICFESYIFAADTVGEEFVAALIAAQARGISVQLLVDGIGSLGFSRSLLPQLSQAGVNVRIYHPTPFDLIPDSRHSFFFQVLRALGRLNRRNHRKVLIVDRATVIVGSANVSLCHRAKEQGGGGWRDTSVLLRGRQVEDFIIAFSYAWRYAHSVIGFLRRRTLRPLYAQDVWLNITRKMRRQRRYSLRAKVLSADRRIWITNAYFVPQPSLLKILRDAAKRGVDVRILLPQRPDIWMMRWIGSMSYLVLLSAGVKIYEYRPAVLHAKSWLIDQQGIVGTSNLNSRSLLHDLEVDVLISSEQAVIELEKLYREDLLQSGEVTLDLVQRRSWLYRIVGSFLMWVRYWL